MIISRTTSRRTAACLSVASLALLEVVAATFAVPTPAKAATPRASGIVFVSDRDSPPQGPVNDEVYLHDDTTGDTSRLTTNSVPESFPVLSPDGRYLSYLTNTGISVCPLSFAAGSWSCGPARGVINDPGPAGGKFAWTPDGRSIVYGGTDPVGGDIDVFSVRLFKLEPARNLTQEAPGELAVFDGQPSVSTDGQSIVYGHGGDLYRRNIDGTQPVALTATPTATEFGPAYSPDGSKIAFHSNRPGPTNFDIYVMRAKPESADNPAVDLTSEFTAPDDHTPSRERFPTWSPDGAKIAFWWHVTPQGLDDGEIYTMRADGTAIENLTANNPTDTDAQQIGDIMPAWGSARRH